MYIYQINPTSKTAAKAIYNLLIDCGLEGPFTEDGLNKFVANKFSFLIDAELKNFSGDNRLRYVLDNKFITNGKIITVDEFLAILNKRNNVVLVKLNDDYGAVVSADEVTVGCQKFSFDTIDKLKAAVDQVRSGKQ